MKFSNRLLVIAATVISATTLPLLTPFATYAALPGAHSDTVNGDVFLGGDYIELGLSQYGSFGTDEDKPSSFFGTAARNQIGMSADYDGFDNGTDWRMDYFMPGTQEERWSIGYTIGSTQTTAANARRNSTTQITDNTVTNQSSGNNLKATSVGTYGSNLQITQVIEFEKSNKFFKNTVTLKNIHGSNTLDSVRYMRSFDPDNTRDQGGGFATQNTIVYTHAAGDGKAVVQADTSNNASDPVYTGTGGASGGSRSPILFYSSDTSARVAYHSSLTPGTVYASGVYASVQSKGSTVAQDGAISIAFDVGSLTPGAEKTIIYYTSLDSRDFSEVIEDIQENESQSSPSPTPTATPTVLSAKTEAPHCSMAKPLYTPNLFQIDTKATEATLYFAPPADTVTGYTIEYGTNTEANQHAVSFNHADKSGAVPYTIKSLASNTKWYFKVKAVNGCESGNWSNTKDAFTGHAVAPQAVTTSNEETPQPIVSPTPKATPTEKPKDSSKPTASPSPTASPISSKEPTQAGLHDVIIKVREGEKAIAGAQIQLGNSNLKAVTNEQGIAEFKDVPSGKQKFSIVKEAFAADETVNVQGEEKAINVNVWLNTPDAGFKEQSVQIVVGLLSLLILLLLLMLAKKRRNKQ